MTDKRLADTDRFHAKGYLGPFEVLPEEEAVELRRRIDTNVLRSDSGFEVDMPANFWRHLDCPEVWELCSHPKIIDRMKEIYGPDLMLWHSRLWQKTDGSSEVPWHQHYHHTPLDPPVTLTAWIALTDVTKENGACQILPGTHEKVYPQTEVADHHWDGFDEMADPEKFDTAEAVTMEMRPGEAFIFTERTLHRSFENVSGNRRLSLLERVTIPQVTFDNKKYTGVGADQFTTAMMLAGENKTGYNRTVSPPAGTEGA